MREARVARIISITIPLQSQQMAITGPLIVLDNKEDEDAPGVGVTARNFVGLCPVTRAERDLCRPLPELAGKLELFEPDTDFSWLLSAIGLGSLVAGTEGVGASLNTGR